MSPESPRLFVYLASEAPVAVVLRRGSSEWVRLSLWHTETDLIEHGQWFHGRVYERRCDLSADGTLFVYFARKDDRRAPADSWIAVSRPPWFTALALWVVGGAWSFGGLFPAAGALAIGGLSPPDQGQLPGWLTLTSATPYIERSAEWTDRTVWTHRLRRSGWQPVERAVRETWQRAEPGGDLTLLMTDQLDTASGSFRYMTEYAVLDRRRDELQPLGRCTWADWDQHGRLLFARDGRLWRWLPAADPHLIADFTDQSPDPAPSPQWARDWPQGNS